MDTHRLPSLAAAEAAPAQEEPGGGKKYVIVTACDARYGDYLCEHWLSSLLATAGPAFEAVDIVVLDYGLSAGQREALQQRGVILHSSTRDGHPTNIRYRDAAAFLRQQGGHYRQVLSCDGGDIIFQRDITHLFEWQPTTYRAAVEPLQEHEFSKSIFATSGLDPALLEEILRYIKGQPQINGGFIVAPTDAFLRLCDTMVSTLGPHLGAYAADQVILNYYLRKEGFAQLEPTYNYVILTNHGLSERDGLFYADGELIAVVHNAGGTDHLRSMDNFGIGPGRNRFRSIRHHLIRLFLRLRILALWNAISKRFRRRPQGSGGRE